MGVLPVHIYMSVYHLHVWCSGKSGVSDFLELGIDGCGSLWELGTLDTAPLEEFPVP